MNTIYTLCIYYKDPRQNGYIDFTSKDQAKKAEEQLKENELIAFTDIIEFIER